MGKKKPNPYTEFIMEMIKKLDTPDLQMISRAVNEQLSGERIIDIPITQPFEDDRESSKSHEKERKSKHDKEVKLDKKDNFQFDKLNLDNILGQLMQVLGGNNTAHDSTHDDDDRQIPQLFDTQLISSLPKLLQMGSTVGAKSREETLFEAILPFIPEATRTKIESMRPFLKVYQIIQTLR